MAATMGFPFTSAQWKELERQAMIYKYMMASVPVPPDLLSADPTASHSPSLGGGGSIFNLRYSNNKDPEPGRCKRTDGKKWRCSRDVAPHQKYCERHMHRGRPRSRKPVEVHAPPNTSTATTKKTRLHHSPLPTTPTVQTNGSSPQLFGSTIQPNETPLLLHKTDEHLSASGYKEPSRGLDWAMEGEMVTMDTAEQQWQHLMQTNIGLTTESSIYNSTASVFQQEYGEEPLNLLSYTGLGAPEDDQQNDECTLFLNPNLVSMEKQAQIETPRGFIDAWSNDNPNTTNNNNSNSESSVSSHGNLSPSSLTLSMAMAAGNALDEEMGQIQMGLGVTDSDNHKPQVSSWQSPVSWVASTPGGPLAEVLRPSTIAMCSNPTSPYAGNGGAISLPATTVSFPSGVVHRTMLSLSDSRVCNSPTLASSTATPEIAGFPWMS